MAVGSPGVVCGIATDPDTDPLPTRVAAALESVPGLQGHSHGLRSHALLLWALPMVRKHIPYNGKI